MLVILTVKNPVTSPTKDGNLGALTVGIALGMVVVSAKNGPCLNPAIGFSETFWGNWYPGGSALDKIYILWGGPLLGGILAGLFHRFVQSKMYAQGSYDKQDSDESFD